MIDRNSHCTMLLWPFSIFLFFLYRASQQSLLSPPTFFGGSEAARSRCLRASFFLGRGLALTRRGFSRFSLLRLRRERRKRATGVFRGSFAPQNTPVALFQRGGVACQTDAEDRQKPIPVRGFGNALKVTFEKPCKEVKSNWKIGAKKLIIRTIYLDLRG